MLGAITIDPERRFLRCQFDQHATVTDWVEARAVFVRLAEETGIRRGLVDVRKQRVAGPTIELFEFAHSIPSRMVFAVLSSPHSDDHKFVEIAALNRGKNVRLFFGPEDEAIDWLMKGAGETTKS